MKINCLVFFYVWAVGFGICTYFTVVMIQLYPILIGVMGLIPTIGLSVKYLDKEFEIHLIRGVTKE